MTTPSLTNWVKAPVKQKNSLSNTTTGLPEVQGGWMDSAKLGLGAIDTGVGVYNAINQKKQNDFMESYYKNQMATQKVDFNNAVNLLNEDRGAREGRRLAATQGIAYDSAENVQRRKNYMEDWGASRLV